MLQVRGLLDALNDLEENNQSNFNSQNNDYDFGDVLRFFETDKNKTRGHKLRYSDGTEKTFSFDDN